jgi:hypothetical protein
MNRLRQTSTPPSVKISSPKCGIQTTALQHLDAVCKTTLPKTAILFKNISPMKEIS